MIHKINSWFDRGTVCGRNDDRLLVIEVSLDRNKVTCSDCLSKIVGGGLLPITPHTA